MPACLPACMTTCLCASQSSALDTDKQRVQCHMCTPAFFSVRFYLDSTDLCLPKHLSSVETSHLPCPPCPPSLPTQYQRPKLTPTHHPSPLHWLSQHLFQLALRTRRNAPKSAVTAASLRFWSYKCMLQLGEDRDALTALSAIPGETTLSSLTRLLSALLTYCC
jgi:hypothetical protein